MPKKGTINNPDGPKPIWKTPAAMLKDFEKFLEHQKPHAVKEFREVKRLKKNREHIKRPQSSDYEYRIEEIETLSKPGIVTVSQFAAWKGIHRTTIMTGYSEGDFKDAYQRILAVCEAFSENYLYNTENRNSSGIIFAMKNSHGWTDKSELELSGAVNQPLSEEAKAILAKATRADDDGATES